MTIAVSGLQPTLIAALWPSSYNRAARWVALSLVGSLLLAISAKTQVPFWPVPMTLQTAVLQVLAMAFGWRLGVVTVLLYLAEGLLGFPVFAGTPERGIGLLYMVGPTAGYLAGFVLATLAMGLLAERGWDRVLWKGLLAGIIGNVIVIGLGTAWLAHLLGPAKALALGVTPFLLASALKIALSAAVMSAAWQFVPKNR